MIEEKNLSVKKSQSILTLHKVYVRNLEYKIESIDDIAEQNYANNRKYAFKLSYESISKDIICITLSTKISTEKTKEMLELGVSGEFSINDDINDNSSVENILPEVLTKNAVAILFPYLRTYTSIFSGMTKTSVINIPVFNINKIFENSSKINDID